MVFSSLISRAVPTTKYNNIGARRRVDRIILHHTAGNTDAGNVAYLSGSGGGTSATYCLLTTGDLVGIVPEQFRPWTSNAVVNGVNYDNDWNSVTVETVNTSPGPTWLVSQAQIEMLARLAADLCVRYGWGRLSRTNVVGHREVLPRGYTECPGPYLYPHLDEIVRLGNDLLDGKTPAKPKPPRKVRNMIGIKIVDGEKRYTKDGGTLFATVGASFVEISEVDANAISAHLQSNFANVTYSAWESYKESLKN